VSVWLNGDPQGGTPCYPVNNNAANQPLIKSRVSQLTTPPPARTFVFMEENEQSIDDGMMVIENPALGQWHDWWDMPSERHSGVGIVSFADSHVEGAKWRYPKRFLNHGQNVFWSTLLQVLCGCYARRQVLESVDPTRAAGSLKS
jgi:prepilin-type processing-associated H-X9-DG protein